MSIAISTPQIANNATLAASTVQASRGSFAARFNGLPPD